MDVCVRLLCLCCPVFSWRICDELIPRPKIPTDCVKDQETDNIAKAQQWVVEPQIGVTPSRWFIDSCCPLLNSYQYANYNLCCFIQSTYFPPPFWLPLEQGASMKLSVSLQFLNIGQSVGLLGRVISSSQDLYLHSTI
jgi:hypothetical protein